MKQIIKTLSIFVIILLCQFKIVSGYYYIQDKYLSLSDTEITFKIHNYAENNPVNFLHILYKLKTKDYNFQNKDYKLFIKKIVQIMEETDFEYDKNNITEEYLLWYRLQLEGTFHDTYTSEPRILTKHMNNYQCVNSIEEANELMEKLITLENKPKLDKYKITYTYLNKDRENYYFQGSFENYKGVFNYQLPNCSKILKIPSIKNLEYTQEYFTEGDFLYNGDIATLAKIPTDIVSAEKILYEFVTNISKKYTSTPDMYILGSNILENDADYVYSIDYIDIRTASDWGLYDQIKLYKAEFKISKITGIISVKLEKIRDVEGFKYPDFW